MGRWPVAKGLKLENEEHSHRNPGMEQGLEEGRKEKKRNIDTAPRVLTT